MENNCVQKVGVSQYKNWLTTGAGLSILLGVKGRKLPCASHGVREKNDHKRSFCGCARQPGAERREEADKAPYIRYRSKQPRACHKKVSASCFENKTRSQRCRVLYPAGRFLRGEQPLKLPLYQNTASPYRGQSLLFPDFTVDVFACALTCGV